MSKVSVTASRSYEVHIGAGLLGNIASYVKDVSNAEKICIVSDSNVWPLYGKTIQESLECGKYNVYSFVFPAGEASKNANTLLMLLNLLAENNMTRSDLIVALGGGVVGDLAGFAASVFLRGIPFLQVPTTLLAQVDSSVGGKTAIDLESGKNLVGAFYQPRSVLCDLDTLNTLPLEVFRDGCAEIIKYGILYDPDLFEHLQQQGLQFHRERVITRCVELKRDVVAQDEFDTGLRMKLNLGHTFGHSIEKCSHYQVSHGSAVATGMAMAARAALHLGLCDNGTANGILGILAVFGLPTATGFTPEALTRVALSDKKRSGSTVNLILPRAIGECSICPTPVSDLEPLFKAGL